MSTSHGLKPSTVRKNHGLCLLLMAWASSYTIAYYQLQSIAHSMYQKLKNGALDWFLCTKFSRRWGWRWRWWSLKVGRSRGWRAGDGPDQFLHTKHLELRWRSWNYVIDSVLVDLPGLVQFVDRGPIKPTTALPGDPWDAMDGPANHYDILYRLPNADDVKPQCTEK